MKKIFLSLVALAALAACSKSGVAYTEDDSISFSPVAYNQTKAALAKDAVPTCDLIVSANAGTGNDATTYTEPYFSNVVFTQTATGIFTANGYFWPNVKYLTFSGITKSAGVKIADVTMDVDGNEIEIANYPQQKVDTENNDLMWFEHTTPAGKRNDAIPVAMKHACSWIVLNFIGDETSGNTTRPWKITNITINSLTAAETATLTGSAVWSTDKASTMTLGVYSNGNKTTGGTPLSESDVFTPSANGIIVIPQVPTTLSITYNYVSQGLDTPGDTTDDKVIEEIATVNLNFDGDSDDINTWNAWQPGTKYIYDVTIGAAAIKIAPKAGDWVVYDADGDSGNNDHIEIPR